MRRPLWSLASGLSPVRVSLIFLHEKLTDIENKIKLTRAFKRQLARLQETLGQYRYDVEIDNIL